MNSETRKFIDKIKTIRKNKRLSQVELAKRCGVPQSTIGRIENYSMNPSIDLLISILNVLNIEIELKDKKSIIKGYDVFGKSYGYMLRNDLHDINSIEHKLMQEQIRLDSVSEPFLYGGYQIIYPLENHELFSFSQKFKLKSELESLKAVVEYTSKLASNFNLSLKDMLFGGTEKEILSRGTDWCFDLARLTAVILDCIGLTSRFIFVANPYKAYNGHVLLEVYYNDSWGVIDPLYGYIFFDTKPINAKDIIHSAQLKSMNEDYKHMFNQISIAEYNPNDVNNKYIISKCNEYTYKINTIIQDGTWLLGEDTK
jgi:transcriptional regulator with XRE-family HTH domain